MNVGKIILSGICLIGLAGVVHPYTQSVVQIGLGKPNLPPGASWFYTWENGVSGYVKSSPAPTTGGYLQEKLDGNSAILNLSVKLSDFFSGPEGLSSNSEISINARESVPAIEIVLPSDPKFYKTYRGPIKVTGTQTYKSMSGNVIGSRSIFTTGYLNYSAAPGQLVVVEFSLGGDGFRKGGVKYTIYIEPAPSTQVAPSPVPSPAP